MPTHPNYSRIPKSRRWEWAGATTAQPSRQSCFFVTRGQLRTNIPTQVDGVRTRIIEADLFSKRGVLSAGDSAALEQSAPLPQVVYSVPDAEIAPAKVCALPRTADEWMRKSGVQGVGIGSSGGFSRRSRADYFSNSRCSARSHTTGDRWSTDESPRIEPVPGGFRWRTTPPRLLS